MITGESNETKRLYFRLVRWIGTVKSTYTNNLADPEIPQSENGLERLEDDAIFLMMIGTDAPAQALAITLFHILNNPKVYERLKEELFTTPDSTTVPTGLRLLSIVTTRLPRSPRDEVLQYQNRRIPAGVSSNIAPSS